MWQNEGVHLVLYESDDLRRSARISSAGKIERADMAQVATLIAESTENES